jgi:hypothetical protein
MSEQAIRDQNRVTAMLFKGSDGGTYNVQGDELTGRLLVDSNGGSGTVTTVSVVSANGFAGTVADATTTPAITLSTSVTGILKGNGTAISAITIGSGLSYDGTTLSATGGGTGTVTSVAMSVPTGLTISGSPITTTGTLAVGLDTGYVIPLQSTLDGKANTALSNLASVAINTSLISDTNNTDDLGSAGIGWRTGYFATSVYTPIVRAQGSGGVEIKNSTGTDTIITGAGGGTGTSIVGTTNIGSASADYHQVAGGTGTITDTATGSSTNININLVPKGTGRLQAGGVTVPTISSTDTLTNKTITNSNNVLGGVTMTLGSDADGDTYYRSSNVLTRIPKGTAGQVYTMNAGATAPEWQTPSGSFAPTTIFSTMFETAGRFLTNHSGGTATFGTSGVSLSTTTTMNRVAEMYLDNPDSCFDGSPKMNARFRMSAIGAGAGYGYVVVGGLVTTENSVNRHFGFKIGIVAGVATLYASQSNGTTNSLSSALTTFVANEDVQLMAVKNSTTSIDYYWRLNGGSWSSATNRTSSMPSGDTDSRIFSARIANPSSGVSHTLVMQSFAVEV